MVEFATRKEALLLEQTQISRMVDYLEQRRERRLRSGKELPFLEGSIICLHHHNKAIEGLIKGPRTEKISGIDKVESSVPAEEIEAVSKRAVVPTSSQGSPAPVEKTTFPDTKIDESLEDREKALSVREAQLQDRFTALEQKENVVKERELLAEEKLKTIEQKLVEVESRLSEVRAAAVKAERVRVEAASINERLNRILADSQAKMNALELQEKRISVREEAVTAREKRLESRQESLSESVMSSEEPAGSDAIGSSLTAEERMRRDQEELEAFEEEDGLEPELHRGSQRVFAPLKAGWQNVRDRLSDRSGSENSVTVVPLTQAVRRRWEVTGDYLQRHRKRVLVGVAVLAAAAGLTAGYFLYQGGQESQPRQNPTPTPGSAGQVEPRPTAAVFGVEQFNLPAPSADSEDQAVIHTPIVFDKPDIYYKGILGLDNYSSKKRHA